jgi:hypothetical protein
VTGSKRAKTVHALDRSATVTGFNIALISYNFQGPLKHPADMSTPGDDEPPSKKMRSEESLMPEAQFLAKYKVHVCRFPRTQVIVGA